MPIGPDVPWTEPTQPETGKVELELDGTETDIVETPDTGIDSITIGDFETLKAFFEAYTLYVIQYIELNEFYFSYNLCDFKIVKTESIELYKRQYNEFGDYIKRKEYATLDLNALCNDINNLEFLG